MSPQSRKVPRVDVTVAEELLLIAYNEETGRREWWSPQLGRGLAGAVLADLALAKRIDLVDGRVHALDPAPVGDPQSDAVLARIVAQDPRQEPEIWVGWLRLGLRNRMLAQLTARGILRRERARILGVYPTWSYPATDSVAKTAARARLDQVVIQGAQSDERTAALGGLLDACGLQRRVFPDIDYSQLAARMADLAAAHWPSAAVRRSIEPGAL